jgi:hypothetical protein
MLTELEQSANDEARHAHRELMEKLEAKLQSMALDYLAVRGQAAEAYQAQLAAEAKLAKVVEALVAVDALDPEGLIDGCSHSALRGLVLRMGSIARTTLAELKGDSQ